MGKSYSYLDTSIYGLDYLLFMVMSEETKKLVIQILNCKSKEMQKMLFAFYKPRLSSAQIEFIYTKTELRRPGDQTLIDYAIKEMGCKKV